MKKLFKWIATVYCVMGIIVYTSMLLFPQASSADAETIKNTRFLMVFLDILLIFFLYLLHRKRNASNKHDQSRSVSPYLSEIPAETLRDMKRCYTATQAHNDARIMQESVHLVQQTSDFDAFFGRLELAQQKALTLLSAAQAGCRGIDKGQTVKSCEAVLSSVQNAKIAFLDRSYEKETTAALRLKTKTAQYKRLNAYLEKLQIYEERFIDVKDAFYKTIQKLEGLISECQSASSQPSRTRSVSTQTTPIRISLDAVSSAPSGALAVPYQHIPKEIFDLLWFSNGPFQNYSGESSELSFDFAGRIIHIKTSLNSEPSAIDINLPITDATAPPTPLGYYPSYANLTPQQRTAYLNWLKDITTPIDIGYVFIFYYGLERHLLFGNAEKALATILILRQFHNNTSFLGYSEDALVLYALLHNRPEILQNLDCEQASIDLRLFIAVLSNHCLNAQDIMTAYKKLSFDNNRYIKGEPELFLSTLEGLLLKQYASPVFSVSLDDLTLAQGTFTLVLANYSLLPQQRVLELPDITTSPRIQNALHALLVETHESVKAELRERRKTQKQNNTMSDSIK